MAARSAGGRPNEQPSLGLTPLSRVRRDELLQEMLDRVGEVMTSRERLRALLDAVVGMDPALARGGVVNMGERAHDLGGSFEDGPGPGGRGTTVTWRVPVAG
ncbi:hypothetical protein [Actinoplanes sp. NPDC049118]|uniref:hypothetical protein n=1 Tax=Actinoplanes sp. NPDC049118 TaxID=3155769 RepID=UPI00340BB4EB